ncbi:MAG TPA: hypothetical protein VGA00_00435, partial [Acidiferrobacterales bacterium]
MPSATRKAHAERPRQRAAQRPGQEGGQHGNRQQQRQNRIRLADVADHLAGVDEIIHRDEIETGFEFDPEQQFGQRIEQQRRRHKPEHPVAHPALPARRAPAVTERGFVQQERHQQVTQDGHVEPHSHGQETRPAGQRDAVHARVERQNDPGGGKDTERDQHQQRDEQQQPSFHQPRGRSARISLHHS